MAGYKRLLVLIKEHLQNEETIKASVYGAYECKIMGTDSVRNGVFVATENRLVFFSKKLIGYELETFPFKSISSIEKSKGMLGHAITVYSSGNNAKMKWIKSGKGDVLALTEFVNSKIGNAGTSESNQLDIPAQIQKLANLKEQRILTEEEFISKKAELLAKI